MIQRPHQVKSQRGIDWQVKLLYWQRGNERNKTPRTLYVGYSKCTFYSLWHRWFFKQLEQSILYTFWDFEQHLQQEDCGIPQDKVEMAEAGTNTPEIHQSTEDIWNPSPPPKPKHDNKLNKYFVWCFNGPLKNSMLLIRNTLFQKSTVH